MTMMHIRQCPRCELRFTSSSELEDHLTNDHRPLEDHSDVTVAPAPSAALSQLPDVEPSPVVSPAAARGLRVLTWVFALAGLLLIGLMAWLASTATAVITSALVVLLALCYLWRARTRTRTRSRSSRIPRCN